MITSINVRNTFGSYQMEVGADRNKIVINLGQILVPNNQYDILITFDNEITHFRNHDYTWVDISTDRIANEFSAKLIKFADGTYVQPNILCGIWEVNRNNPKVLLWRFNPENAATLTTYIGNENRKIVIPAHQVYNFDTNLSLLISKNSGIEFSRSPIPFSAIACFTDHCDYDTIASLKLQREFFKKVGIIVTKGFFLNHFSKRNDNASFQNDAAELLKWKEDGHELAYHSLSQSIKPLDTSLSDFATFTPPFDVPTYIDHGYQPYNFSLFQFYGINEKDYEQTIVSKNIRTLWNYTDSGTAALGVINQLNPQHFTLASFAKGNRNLTLSTRISLMIKNIMFHYYGDEKIILAYKGTAGSFKKIFYQKQLKSVVPFFRNFLNLTLPILKVFVTWSKSKRKPYKLAYYSPLIFRHKINEVEVHVFQTLEMVDFRKSLHPTNIDKLIAESGVFIAHTYFSAPMSYHTGKMFSNPDIVDQVVAENFKYLGNKIESQKLWNPTFDQLDAFLSNFKNAILDIDAAGNVFVLNASNLPYRTVN